MKLKITLYLSFALFIIFSCSQDERAVTSNFAQTTLIKSNLVSKPWKHTEIIDDKFSQKAEIHFFKDGRLVKKDSYNYLGIEEYYEEEGKWSLDKNGQKLRVLMDKTKKELIYTIVYENANSFDLISVQNERRYEISSI